MASSYKSHFSPPTRADRPSPPVSQSQRASSTRFPTRSVTPALPAQSQLPVFAASTVSSSKKLQKKYSKDNAQESSASGITVQQSRSTGLDPLRKPAFRSMSSGLHPPHVSSGPSIASRSSSRLPKFDATRGASTPSLVSGSSISTVDSPRSNKLRRKPSSIGRQVQRVRATSVSSDEEDMGCEATIPISYKDAFSGTALGISMPAIGDTEKNNAAVDSSIGSLYPLTTENLPPPTPLYALSGTPSTRYSESPGPFSLSSTPTSMSSSSPGVMLASARPTARTRQINPMQSRPPVTRRRTEEPSTPIVEPRGLSSVRESSASSSSASTVRHGDTQKHKQMEVQSRLPAPPLSPPMQRQWSNTTEYVQKDPSSRGDVQNTKSPHFRAQAPPELAHLAHAIPPQIGHPTVRRPSRPSRDGAPDISGMREPSPIIQSNLISLPAHHRRTSSIESRSDIAGTFNGSKTRLAIPSPVIGSSRNASPSRSNPTSGIHPTTSRAPIGGPSSENQPDRRAKTLPMTGSSPSKTSSKFGFLTRRTRTEPSPTTSTKPEKKARKGPAAGTGHEGYGRYANRGRSGSTTSATGSCGRSASVDSTYGSTNRNSTRKSSFSSTKGQEMDEFLAERLAPVVIRGSGSTDLLKSPDSMRSDTSLDSTISRTASRFARDAFASQAGVSSFSVNSAGLREPSAPPPTIPNIINTAEKIGTRATTVKSSESDGRVNNASSSISGPRKHSRWSSLVSDKYPIKLPTLNSSRVDLAAPPAEDGDGVKEKNVSKTKKPAKPQKKWNFFQRSYDTKKEESVDYLSTTPRIGGLRSVPHYAMVDPADHMDMEDIEKILREADDIPDPDTSPSDIHANLQNRPAPEHVHSILLPDPPSYPTEYAHPMRPASPKVSLRRGPVSDLRSNEEARPNASVASLDAAAIYPPPQAQPSSPQKPQSTQPLPSRPSRLPQVGRIPKVVPRRPQGIDEKQCKPSMQSFSRPFTRDEPPPSMPAAGPVVGPRETSKAKQSPPMPAALQIENMTHQFHESAETASMILTDITQPPELFKFPPRKDSEHSYSTSSSGWSVSVPTAVIPPPDAPLSDDEVWDEYDDLIDDVLSPSDLASRIARRTSSTAKDFKAGSAQDEERRITPESSSASQHHPASIHLRRSRLLSVLRSSQSTLPSASEFTANNSDHRISIINPVTGRLGISSAKRTTDHPASTCTAAPAASSAEGQQFEHYPESQPSSGTKNGPTSRYRDTRLLEMAEAQNSGLMSMANLRFGALMTSKWLSFGRVLFSPVHSELKNPAEDRILVIDGLGKDWSYYCALTYPKATVYNLGLDEEAINPTLPVNATTSTPWSTLSNHRHLAHPSLSSPFPFPRGFFAGIVLRFPPASSSATYAFVIKECKRVLRPGGYLELCMLDMDLLNMGNQARKAVRALKLRIQAVDETVSLRSLSDEVMRLVGRRGFEDCRRGVVGVPVAGSDASPTANANGGVDVGAGKSFSELLDGEAEITDMVARVGRWWYKRCYEVAAGSGEGGVGMWAEDRELLEECREWGTSFRLVMGYAQKPVVKVRRTVSV